MGSEDFAFFAQPAEHLPHHRQRRHRHENHPEVRLRRRQPARGAAYRVALTQHHPGSGAEPGVETSAARRAGRRGLAGSWRGSFHRRGDSSAAAEVPRPSTTARLARRDGLDCRCEHLRHTPPPSRRRCDPVKRATAIAGRLHPMFCLLNRAPPGAHGRLRLVRQANTATRKWLPLSSSRHSAQPAIGSGGVFPFTSQARSWCEGLDPRPVGENPAVTERGSVGRL